MEATNITVTKVKNTLGVSNTNVSSLCTSDKVNKYSKYKPVRLNSTNTSGNSDWYKAQDGNCGFEIPLQTYPEESASKEWKYLKPRGIANNEPYRLGDFREYEHNFTNPFVVFEDEGNPIYIDIDQTTQFAINLRINWTNGQTSGNDKQLRTDDFDESSIGHAHLGVVIIFSNNQGSNTTRLCYTDTVQLSKHIGNESYAPITIDTRTFEDYVATGGAMVYFSIFELGGLNGIEWNNAGKKWLMPKAIQGSPLQVLNGKFRIAIKGYSIGRHNNVVDNKVRYISNTEVNKMYEDTTFWVVIENMTDEATYFNPSEYEIEYDDVAGVHQVHPLYGNTWKTWTTNAIMNNTLLVPPHTTDEDINIKVPFNTSLYDSIIYTSIKIYWISPVTGNRWLYYDTSTIMIQDNNSYDY